MASPFCPAEHRDLYNNSRLCGEFCRNSIEQQQPAEDATDHGATDATDFPSVPARPTKSVLDTCWIPTGLAGSWTGCPARCGGRGAGDAERGPMEFHSDLQIALGTIPFLRRNLAHSTVHFHRRFYWPRDWTLKACSAGARSIRKLRIGPGTACGPVR